eukprot:g15724.t1
MIMQIDSNDDTVLVETSGICECKIWYPRLAVVPVYDPDLEEEPQFNVNDHVECKMQILDRLERTVFLTTGFGVVSRVVSDWDRDRSVLTPRSGWEPGVVKEVLWLKGQRCGPVPYTVVLDNGTSIFVPLVSLIRPSGGVSSPAL